ncbi:MAG: ABC transporter substrate-binding protein [Conexivisphaerales archaeon]
MRELFNEVLGKKITLPEKIEKIVSLNPSITESLFMMGLGDKVAAVSAFCARPPEARSKRKIGSYNTVNEDVLDSIEPDIIFTITGYQRQLAFDLSKKYSVYPLELPTTVLGILDMVTKIGLAIGEYEKGRSLSTELLGRLLHLLPGKVDYRPKIYLEIDLGGSVTFGAYSYITDAIYLLGGSNVYGNEQAEWLQPDLTRLNSVAPDIFIYEAKMYSDFHKEDLERLIDSRGWRNMRFITNGTYYLAPGPLDFFAHHGPSFILDTLPWLKEKLDIYQSKYLRS